MDVPAGRPDATDAGETADTGQGTHEPLVSCHETSPGRLVLTERHNVDGWLASDHVVDLEP